jgi:hypothetical protein
MPLTRHRGSGTLAVENRTSDAATSLADYGITDAASDTELSTHEADTTSVHGITDTAQVALKNAANIFTTTQSIGVAAAGSNAVVISAAGNTSVRVNGAGTVTWLNTATGTTDAALTHTSGSSVIVLTGSMRISAALEIDGDFNHDGANFGARTATPVAISAAYTQTFATADRTHAARTAAALTDNVAGTVGATVAAIPNPADTPADADTLRDDLVTNVLPAIRNAISSLIDQINKGRVDALDTSSLVNSLVDDIQLQGLLG